MTGIYKNYSFFDLLCKIKERILDYLFLPYWKMRLGKIGKGSRIKRGVKILGSGKRITIGENFKIWHRCFIAVGTGKISIGAHGHLGVDVFISTLRREILILVIMLRLPLKPKYIPTRSV